MIAEAVAGFVGALRQAGLPVSPTEHADALGALRSIGMGDRERVRGALAATTVKRHEHRDIFDTLFEIWFTAPPGAGDGVGWSDAELMALLDAVLESGDADGLRLLSQAAVARFAGLDASARLSGTAYPAFATMRALDVDGALARLLAGGAGQDTGPGLEALLRGEEVADHAREVKAAVAAEVRRRMVGLRGREEVARGLRRPLPEDIDLLHASQADIAALRRALGPLARRMATRLARSRHHRRRGRIDVRDTVRHSLSYGGALAEPRFRRRHPYRPELLVLADVSGSVAAFARFTLELVHAVSGQFSGVRSFVFVDGVDEVTRIFDTSGSLEEAVRRVDAEADVVWADGHSDYGHALEDFWQRWGSEVTGRTSVVMLGDARNNYHRPGDWALAELARRARRLWWLNPEPRSYWDTGDSIASVYAAHCDGMVECRTLRQLEQFVASVA